MLNGRARSARWSDAAVALRLAARSALGLLRLRLGAVAARGGLPGRAARAHRLEQRVLFAAGSVVINEIHYNPDVSTEAVQFVELTNPGTTAVDLSNASFTKGISYTFAPGTTLQPGGYVVVAENLAAFQQKFGTTALGPFSGSLSNSGEDLVIKDAAGNKLDEVDYGAGFPWPTVGDAPGYSIELINPALDNNLGGSWRSFTPASGDTTLFPTGTTWHYRKGTSEASSPVTAWRNLTFSEDASWLSGPAPIGYDPAVPISTKITDMDGNYTSLFFRKTFTIADPSVFSSLRLEAMYDDGFNLWVNGNFVRNVNTPAAELPYTSLASTTRESSAFDTFQINPSFLQAGNNVVAVELFNILKSGSSDAFLDARLIGSGGGAGPTPGRRNAAFAANAAPQMRQVANVPQQPLPGQVVTITAKVTDPNGVASVSLSYQLVDPGNYIALEDAAYKTNWTNVAMHDDGLNGDAVAGDSTYSVILPASLQTYRRLIRYRVTSTDTLGASITGPYPDDPTPNFAYYVYGAAAPAWSGAIQPGATGTNGQVVTYGTSVTNSTAVYQLITKKTDHDESQHIPNATSAAYTGDNYLWTGTLIYDGVVYDDIHYRSRGGVWRYAMGKNMWKFDLNRGHFFQARDAYGNLYPEQWSKLNLGADIQQGDIGMRGEQGLFETLGFQLFNLAGVPASLTTPIQFRIVENASETGDPANQYDDDFQGLYLAVEQDNGVFLNEHNLPNGNFYKMEGGTGPGGGTLNNQGPSQPADNSDLVAFTTALVNNPTDQWVRDNVDLDSYYSYKAIVKAIHHFDIGFGKNYYYYHNPDTNKWSIIPWDLDLTWYVNYSPANGDSDPFETAFLSRPVFQQEYRNRVREVRDLLYNDGEMAKLADAYAALVNPAGAAQTLVQADRAMWDYNPILASSYVTPSKAGQGRYYQGGQPTQNFAGMVARLKSFATTREAFIDSSVLTSADEAAAPARGTVSYTGPAGFAANQLTFSTTGFAPGNTGGSFAAMEWRIADVTPAAAGQPQNYEINAAWQSGAIGAFSPTVTIPASGITPGHTYRVRMRFQDSNGRWGHWSNVSTGVTEFVVGAVNDVVVSNLRITEINYNPGGESGPLYTGSDYEYIELKNIGAAALDLTGVQFTAGVTETFPSYSLPAGASGVVVKNPTAFAERYGTGIPIIGTFTGSLDNSGEELLLATSVGATVQDFSYNNSWLPSTDGNGYTLQIVNPAADPSTWSSSTAWRASKFVFGSPGMDESATAVDSVVVNELLSHSHGTAGDWIEFKNTTASPIDISGWYLTDSASNLLRYAVPAGSVIAAGGYLVLNESTSFGSAFSFSEDGDSAYLSASAVAGVLSGYRQGVSFGAAESDVPFGRYTTSTGRVDFVAMSAPTPGAANAYPKVGPVVINEVMYHPSGTAMEYIELKNITGAAVPLYDAANPSFTWKFTDGIDYAFPTGASIPAGGYALVVGGDPATFRAQNNIPASVPIFGPYIAADGSNALNNGGERLELSKPLPFDPNINADPYAIVDALDYDVIAPWPTTPDGGGPSLSRLSSSAYGNDVINWSASLNAGGTPGASNLAVAAVAGRFVFYNHSFFDGGDVTAGGADDGAVATDKQPLLPGQTASFANYTSYSLGINGIMLDLNGLPVDLSPTAGNFVIKVGNTVDPSTWAAGPTPTISVRRGAGVGGSDRVTLLWPDGSILGKWVQVSLTASANTGQATDRFYFGNAPGESGNSAGDTFVDGTDFAGARDNGRNFLNRAPIDFRWDYNRDSFVDGTDIAIARDNNTNFLTALKLITAPTSLGLTLSPPPPPVNVVVSPPPPVSPPPGSPPVTVAKATVQGLAYVDANRNGTKDSKETLVPAGLRVYLDLDGNGSWDGNSEPSAVVDATGHWKISGITRFGKYRLKVAKSGTSGWSATTTPTVTVQAGKTTSGVQIGVHA